MVKHFSENSFIIYIICRKRSYLSSDRVKDKTIIFISMFIHLLLYIREINFIFINQFTLLKTH